MSKDLSLYAAEQGLAAAKQYLRTPWANRQARWRFRQEQFLLIDRMAKNFVRDGISTAEGAENYKNAFERAFNLQVSMPGSAIEVRLND